MLVVSKGGGDILQTKKWEITRPRPDKVLTKATWKILQNLLF